MSRLPAAVTVALAAAVVLMSPGSSKGDEAPIVTGFTSEEDLLQLFQLSASENPEIYVDVPLESTASFLNLTRGEATLASFLDVGPASPTDAITADTLASCDPEDSVLGSLERGAGDLDGLDFGLTLSALKSTGLSSMLDATKAPEGGAFMAYALVAPTDSAWVKLKQRLEESPSSAEELLPLQQLLLYNVYGETNQTFFNAVASLVDGSFLSGAPYEFFLNVPIDMIDGNTTVLSTTAGSNLELNGSPIVAAVRACNGVVLAVDDVLLPGAAVEQFMGRPEEAAGGAEAGGGAEAFGSSEGKGDGCGDTVPPSPLGKDWTCKDQLYWGKCQQYWMWDGDYCRETCGYCGHDSFPYAQAAEQEEERREEEEEESGYVDPCSCTKDGISGGVSTGVSGCATMTASQLAGMAYASSVSDSSASINIGREFGSRFDGYLPRGTPEFNYCYVVSPSECRQYTEPSPFFEGVRWKFC